LSRLSVQEGLKQHETGLRVRKSMKKNENELDNLVIKVLSHQERKRCAPRKMILSEFYESGNG
jgi:hypothetical protein